MPAKVKPTETIINAKSERKIEEALIDPLLVRVVIVASITHGNNPKVPPFWRTVESCRIVA
jgi:hypothetical protein